MLNKLLRHEFRATGRIMLPTLGALLVLSIMAGVSFRIMSEQSNVHWAFAALLGLLQGAFFLSLFAIFVLVFVLIVIRFYKSLMGDEGYLSFTLPVSVDGHLWNKLITSLVWIVAVVIVTGVSAMLFFAIGERDPLESIPDIFAFLRTFSSSCGVVNTIGFALEGIAAAVLVCFSQCLHFYAAIAIGGSAAKSKKLLAVISYFALSVLRNILFLISAPVLTSRGLWQWLNISTSFEDAYEAIPMFHVIASGCCLALVIIGAIYYLIARFNMTRKLNLA